MQKMSFPHVLAIPYPAQGHVIPLLELSHCLASHGFRVTFVNTEFNHRRVVDALAGKESSLRDDRIRLVSIPDGLEAGKDRNDLGKLTKAIFHVMPGKLEELIREIEQTEGKKIACVVVDKLMGWALEVAYKMNIPSVAFWPASATLLALISSVPKLISDGIVSEDGVITQHQAIELAPGMPTVSTKHLSWVCMGDLTTQKILFRFMVHNSESVKLADWLICNSSHGLEPAAFAFAPQILPIGPLLASRRLGRSTGYFWPEDSSCLKWLDQQAPKSVIYVAFGSFTTFDLTQFHDLGLGLELSNRPFLWVVRPDTTEMIDGIAYPEKFKDRVSASGQAKLVGWAPQQEVLAHPSIACFLSHCGWNSTIEGVSNGVPFLCWPYFADQFFNESYLCDVWRVGLRLDRDGSGIVRRGEIARKVDRLLDADDSFSARALVMKELVMKGAEDGGESHKNLSDLVEWMKAL